MKNHPVSVINDVSFLSHSPQSFGKRIKESLLDHRTAAATLGLIGALTVGAVVSRSNTEPVSQEDTPSHSIAYLSSPDIEKQTGIVIEEGDSPTDIAIIVNGLDAEGEPRLRGQALLDAAEYIESQGSIEQHGPDGKIHHVLFAGDAQHPSDTVMAPVLSDNLIEDVNSGRVG